MNGYQRRLDQAIEQQSGTNPEEARRRAWEDNMKREEEQARKRKMVEAMQKQQPSLFDRLKGLLGY